jgi:hypothetical protein
MPNIGDSVYFTYKWLLILRSKLIIKRIELLIKKKEEENELEI